MFNSIKLRFVTIYFVLVLVIMAIVGMFIITKLEESQIEDISEETIESVGVMSQNFDIISKSNWLLESDELQAALDENLFGLSDKWYMIYDGNIPTIVASTVKSGDTIKGKNAMGYPGIENVILEKAFKDNETDEKTVNVSGEKYKELHIAYPVVNKDGGIQGVIYVVVSLENVYDIVESAKGILTNATVFALLITVVLGFALASSITGPISDVTKQAEEMAYGNFDLKVEVKSDDEIGKLGSMFNYLTDELNLTIANMDLERAKLDTIFNYMAEGVIAVDSSGRLIHANSIAKDLLKLSDLDISIGSEQDLSKLNIEGLNYNSINTLEGVASIELDDRFYNIKYAPYLEDDTHASGIILVFQDITKEHKLDDMRKEFVANVSHELKTPITTIKTYTETLLEGDVDPQTGYEFLKIINRESDRMSRLVMDLLELSNIDYKYTNWEYENINLNKLIEQSVYSLELMRSEKNQSLEMKAFRDDIYVYGDRNALEKIFMNIISNALKYTGEKGNIQIELMDFKNTAQITVKDNGVGIPYKDQRRIFERFYRVEKGRSRMAGGTGLGLSISKELVEELGGTIRMKSTPNIGTEIVITLPKKGNGAL